MMRLWVGRGGKSMGHWSLSFRSFMAKVRLYIAYSIVILKTYLLLKSLVYVITNPSTVRRGEQPHRVIK